MTDAICIKFLSPWLFEDFCCLVFSGGLQGYLHNSDVRWGGATNIANKPSFVSQDSPQSVIYLCTHILIQNGTQNIAKKYVSNQAYKPRSYAILKLRPNESPVV